MRIFNNSVALEVRIKQLNCDQVFVCTGLALILTLASTDEGHLLLATGNELLVIRKLRISGNSVCGVVTHPLNP